MPEYRSAEQARSVELHAAADEHHEHGTRAKLYADRYILATVFMAAGLLVSGGAYVLTLPLA